MAKRDVERAKRRMKRYDPQLVMMALQDIDVSKADVEKAKTSISKAYAAVKAKAPQEKMKVLSQAMAEVNMEVIQKEIETVRASLKEFDRETLTVAVSEAFEIDPAFCIFPICICPEGGRPPDCQWFFKICHYFLGGCNPFHQICFRCLYLIPYDQPFPKAVDLEHIGLSVTQAIRELDVMDMGSIVIGDGTRLGPLEKCFDPVSCTGRQIWVMSKCTSALFTFDLKGIKDPVEAIQRIAETDSTLQRRVKRMVDAMKKAGEL